ncbi:MAG TPA: hypothetical protein VFU99_09985 [Gaiellaceae bacterium]|nr:hypothetical protein [Gaiellaceae bacterium]
MKRRLLVPFAVVAAGIAVAGCGGGDSTSSGVSTESISVERLTQSASTSAEATSGRFAFAMSLTFPGADEPFSLSGEGAFDKASKRASFSADMSSFAQLLGGLVAGLAGPDAKDLPDFDDPAGWKIDVIQDGDVGYLRFPAFGEQLPEGKTWLRAKEGEKTAVGGFDFEEFQGIAKSDPRELLEALRAVSSEIETVGGEQLRGVDTTHYRAVVDPAELAKLAQAEKTADTETLVDQLTSQSGLEPIPVDVWLDENGLVRKVEMALEATDSSTGQSSAVSMSFELWDYGEPVEIELPPPSEVADASAVGG